MKRMAGVVAAALLAVGCSSEPFSNDLVENTAGLCADGQDNDGDGKIDCADPDCAATCGTDDGGSSWPDVESIPDRGSVPDTGGCAASEATAKNKILPVDIIWFVDTSGSMDFETATVQNNLNAFAQSIGASGLDYHVVMVAESSVCVPAPLGGPGCTDGTSYKHIKMSVDSHDGLEKLIAAYPQYQSFLRPDAIKHFVAVTDDNSSKNAAWFQSQIAALTNPGFPKGFVFHSIVAYGAFPFIGCLTGAAIGVVYLTLTQSTGGVKAEVCATDWTPIFTALAQGVVSGTTVPCSYVIPPPPTGKTIDPKKVNVSFTPAGGQATTIPKVMGQADCATKSGWYYDNETNPTTITFCASTCSSLGQGSVKILFGCTTVIE